MATMEVGHVPCFGFCDGCTAWGQRMHVKVSVTPNVFLSFLCQICEDYVTQCLKDGDQEGVLCILEGRLPPGWHAALAEEVGGNDGKGKGKGKEVHEADKAGGWGKAEGKGRDRSRSPRRHAA